MKKKTQDKSSEYVNVRTLLKDRVTASGLTYRAVKKKVKTDGRKKI